jgi:steroid 5-alpha reductase family enzyme
MMLLLIGWLIIALMMFGLWFVQRYSLNATFVDIGWAASIGLLAFLYAVQGPGLISRRMLVWFLVE